MQHRAHLWNLEKLNGCLSLANENQGTCHYRNELIYLGIQQETRGQNSGNYNIDEKNACVRSVALICFKNCIMKLSLNNCTYAARQD